MTAGSDSMIKGDMIKGSIIDGGKGSDRAHPAAAGTGQIPLYVDLDHTLVQTDLAQEMLLRACRQPRTLFAAVQAQLTQGPAALKAVLARDVPVAVDRLPYNPAVLRHIRQARTEGRRVVLATAADQQIANQVAAHLGLFDDVIASDANHNMKAANKLAAITADMQAQGHQGGFEYLGDSRADLPIWQAAERRGFAAIPKGAEHWQAQATLRPGADSTGAGTATERYTTALKRAMRPHQWSKNFLLFLPLLFAHLYGDLDRVLLTCLGFVAFCLCASAIYLLNDLLDIEADRAHPTKKNRPFAAGQLPPGLGFAAAMILMVLSLALAACLSGAFLAAVLVYILFTASYSLWLKQFSTIDVVVLALLYTLRIIAGAAAASVWPSPWLLTFSLFFFLSLAYMKRYIELSRLARDTEGVRETEGQSPVAKAATQEATDRLPVRNYYTGDLTIVQTFGISNGALSLLTLAEYVSSDLVQQQYPSPVILWLMLPVMMLWTYRAWMWANRDQIGDDPVAFALRDRVSHLAVLALVLIVALARYVDLG